MEIQHIQIEPIELNWSEWYSFSDVILDAGNSKIKIPKSSGVYEAILAIESRERLTIGQTTNLRQRIRDALVNGTMPHSAGEKIRSSVTDVEFKNILVRWATTIRPHAIEEELHRLYKKMFNCLPKYTTKT